MQHLPRHVLWRQERSPLCLESWLTGTPGTGHRAAADQCLPTSDAPDHSQCLMEGPLPFTRHPHVVFLSQGGSK